MCSALSSDVMVAIVTQSIYLCLVQGRTKSQRVGGAGAPVKSLGSVIGIRTHGRKNASRSPLEAFNPPGQ